MSLLNRIRYVPYRVARHFAIANISCFFMAKLVELQNVPLPDGLVFKRLTSDKIVELSDVHPDLIGEVHHGFLENATAQGYAVFDGDSLVSFLWVAIGNIPGAINHDGHPATQLPIYLPDGIGYIFNVFVMPQCRGRRLYGAMISELSRQLSKDGYDAVMLTTEGSNHRALRSVRRMGFTYLGHSMLLGIRKFTLAKYPQLPMASGIQIGHYLGDNKPHRNRLVRASL